MSKPTTANDKAQLRKNIAKDNSGLTNYIWPFLYPVRLVVNLILAGLRLLRPFTPQLVPFIVFLLALPAIAFLSLSAGWLVWKSVAVGWETDLYLQYGDGTPPFAEVALPNIVAQQPYDITIHLVVPTTESNFALGNFMSTLSLVTPANRTLASIRRPAIVLPPSSAPWSFLYNRPGTVDLQIPLLTSFVPSTTRVIARIELGRRDQWKSIGSGQGRELSVLSAFLRGVVVHKGIRGLINRFPLVSALSAGGTFFFISFIILASCLIPAIEWRYRDDTIIASDIQEKSRRRARRRLSAGDLDDKSPRSSKTPKRSRSVTTRRPMVRVAFHM
ncbi:hypothetical protein BKA93DRAFT_737358 [Sparassis latifolia]